MARVGGSPEANHIEWVRSSAVGDGDRAAYEDEVLCMTLQYMSTVDQLNVPNLVSGELLSRRIQLLREAYRVSPAAPDYSGADFYMGWGARRSGGAVQRNLTSYVADQLRQEAAIAKEARKAKEERTLQRPG